MPYNTRRKSLSLPSLGIHVPVTHAARAAAAAARAAAAAAAAAASEASTPDSSATAQNARNSSSSSPEYPQSKRIKRSHNEAQQSCKVRRLSLASRPGQDPPRLKYEHTPPPSPDPIPAPDVEDDDAETESKPQSPTTKKIDMEGIHDEIVAGVITQLEATGNRPHLVKELAAVLSQRLTAVQNSANPCAIISSRLSTYLKRPGWSAIAPCPLVKELETIHPRRTYFSLTTMPRQPLPSPPSPQLRPRSFISPSLSSAASRTDEADAEARRAISPSPEVDLSAPEFDDMDDDLETPSTSIGSLRLAFHRDRRLRGSSPPLERDEREFTQTANGLQNRKMGAELFTTELGESMMMDDDIIIDDFFFEDGRGFFSDTKALSVTSSGHTVMVVSPAMKPSLDLTPRGDGEVDTWVNLGRSLDWDRTPENIEMDELEWMLEAC